MQAGGQRAKAMDEGCRGSLAVGSVASGRETQVGAAEGNGGERRRYQKVRDLPPTIVAFFGGS